MRYLNRIWSCVLTGSLLLLGALLSGAQDDSTALVSQDFEQNDGGWTSIGASGTVSVTHEAGDVKSGKAALQYKYALKKGEFCLALLPMPDMTLAKAKSIQFWVKTDHDTTLALVLQEKDGGRYNSAFSILKNTWQHVEVNPSDFVLDTGKDAPVDTNGKLDMDVVQGVGLIDVAQLFVQGEQVLADVFGVSEGPRTLFVDDFSASTRPIPNAATLKAGDGSIDLFVRPQVSWLATGELQLSRVMGKPLDGEGMLAKYHQSPSKIVGFSKFLPSAALAGATRLSISAASLKPAKLIVQVEEKGGGKYNTMIELPGSSGRADVSVNFADFKAAQDSHDANNRLDLDQVTQILFYDATGLLDHADADNSLWINNIKAAH